MERATQVGPVARGDLRATLADQVRRSVAMGAQVALGGEPLPGKGFFYAPTILTSRHVRDARLPRGDIRPGRGRHPRPRCRSRR